MKKLLERKLFLLIPFHIVVYKNRIASYNKNEEELKELQKIYQDMVKHLDLLMQDNQLSQDEVRDILIVSEEMINKVAKKHKKVRKALGDILRGPVYELPTDRLIRQGRQEGLVQGRIDMCVQLVKKGVVTLQQAATQLGLTEEEFESKMS